MPQINSKAPDATSPLVGVNEPTLLLLCDVNVEANSLKSNQTDLQ